jgi:hypothetical protein
MSERKPATEELLKRIDELLNVLNIISRDLAEVSKALKTAAPVAEAPIEAGAEVLRGVKDVQTAFPKDLEEMLSFEEAGQYIVIKPRRYLGSDNFAKIASIIRDIGGEYISAGKESHFRVPRELE